jgi:hypothetical protein
MLKSSYFSLKVWWHGATLYYFFFIIYIHTHSFITFAEFRSSFFIAVRSGKGLSLGCRAEIRSRLVLFFQHRKSYRNNYFHKIPAAQLCTCSFAMSLLKDIVQPKKKVGVTRGNNPFASTSCTIAMFLRYT